MAMLAVERHRLDFSDELVSNLLDFLFGLVDIVFELEAMVVNREIQVYDFFAVIAYGEIKIDIADRGRLVK